MNWIKVNKNSFFNKHVFGTPKDFHWITISAKGKTCKKFDSTVDWKPRGSVEGLYIPGIKLFYTNKFTRPLNSVASRFIEEIAHRRKLPDAFDCNIYFRYNLKKDRDYNYCLLESIYQK